MLDESNNISGYDFTFSPFVHKKKKSEEHAIKEAKLCGNFETSS